MKNSTNFHQNPEMKTQKLLLRVPEAAEALSISRSQAYDLIRRGLIPAIKVGNAVRVRHADLEEISRHGTDNFGRGGWCN